MKLERKKNAIRNIQFGLLNKMVTIICPFILRTVIIYTLGSEYLGLSSLFTSVLQVLSLSELGIGSAMVFSLYQPIAEENFHRIQALVSLYRIIYKTIGTVIFVGGLFVLPFLPHFINGTYPEDINIYVLYLLYLFNSSESYFISAYKSAILSAHQRRDVISKIGLIVHVLLYLMQIICLLGFENYYAYVIWLPVFTAVENIVTAVYVNKNYKRFIIKTEVSREDLISILIRVKDLFGHKLSQVVTNSVDTIVISSFLGLQMVTIYNNYYYIMSAVSGILDILYQAILAGIGNSLFSENIEKNEEDFNKFSILNLWMIGWCSICFLCLYQPMMKMWMGHKLMLSIDTVILLSVYFYVWKIRQTVLVYKDAAGMWDIDKWKPYTEIVVNLVFNIILVRMIGINGIVISTIISMLFVSFPWETVVFFKNFFKHSAFKYMRRILMYFGFTLIAGICTYAVCSNISDTGILTFLQKLLICIVLPNLMILILGSWNKHHRKTVRFALMLTPFRKFVE